METFALTAEIRSFSGTTIRARRLIRHSSQSASTKLLQSLATPFEQQRDNYLRQWKRTLPTAQNDLSGQTGTAATSIA